MPDIQTPEEFDDLLSGLRRPDRIIKIAARDAAIRKEERINHHLWGRNPRTGRLEQISDEHHDAGQRDSFEATYREVGWSDFRLEPPHIRSRAPGAVGSSTTPAYEGPRTGETGSPGMRDE